MSCIWVLAGQRLPPGTPADVRAGSYLFSPAHAVEGDVPLESMLAFIEAAQH